MHSLYGSVLKINATVSTQSTSQTPDTVIEKYIDGKGLAVNLLPLVCLDSNDNLSHKLLIVKKG